MTLFTACPACQTHFEVTEAELQAYAGKVRCGECSHVFDAQENLLGNPSSVVLSEADNAASAASPEASADVVSVTEPSPRQDEALQSPKLHAPEIIEDAGDAVAFALNIATPDTPAVATQAIPGSLREVETSAPESKPLDLKLGDVKLGDVKLGDVKPRDLTPRDLNPAPSPKKPVLWAASLLLVLTLAVQMVYFCRVALAANFPASKPWLQAMCKPLHCTVKLPADLAQLTIDDADMQEHVERVGALVFSCILINHSAVTQTLPNIEMTLTNTADEPVMRKRIRPQDYLAAGQSVESGIAPQQELHINTLLGVDEKSVAGFRVSLSY